MAESHAAHAKIQNARVARLVNKTDVVGAGQTSADLPLFTAAQSPSFQDDLNNSPTRSVKFDLP